MLKILIHLGQSLLSGLGAVWLLLKPFYDLGPPTQPKVCFLTFLLAGSVIGFVSFLVNGFFVSGFLKRSIEIKSNAIDTTVKIIFGDLFAQDGCKVVSVNDFFDSAVDDKHVAASSLHGLMLTRCWPRSKADWDAQVARDLADTPPTEECDRPSPGKPNRYAIGTTASVSRNGEHFLCVALTNTCTETLQVSATSVDLQHAVRALLSKARTVCSGRPLNIPLLGSGLGRTGIKPNIIVDLILLAIFEESKCRKVTDHIRIVLPKHLRTRIDLTTIEQDWR